VARVEAAGRGGRGVVTNQRSPIQARFTLINVADANNQRRT
jgi:hypothetical protein